MSRVAEQISQADERATAADRRYTKLEERLEGIEQHLARLVHAIAPARDGGAVDERVCALSKGNLQRLLMALALMSPQPRRGETGLSSGSLEEIFLAPT